MFEPISNIIEKKLKQKGVHTVLSKELTLRKIENFFLETLNITLKGLFIKRFMNSSLQSTASL